VEHSIQKIVLAQTSCVNYLTLKEKPVTTNEYELIAWLISEYGWNSPEQTKKEFIEELKLRLDKGQRK
jgi:hypothetical protein